MADDPSAPHPPNPLKGKLLLANPSLRDGIFDRAVIMLTDYLPDEGASGLILNHPTGKIVSDFIDNERFASLAQIPVYVGGPVSSEQLTFSSFWWDSQRRIQWKTRISTRDAIVQSRKPGRMVRAFLGYSGWSAGQLEAEMERDTWIISSPGSDLLSGNDPQLWAGILGTISPLHRILAEAPADPSLN